MVEDIFKQIAIKIIKEQEVIIGPLAWEEAKKVKGLVISGHEVDKLSFHGNPRQILDELVAQYERLFGKVSREICKAAVLHLTTNLSKEIIPESLR